MYILLFIHAWPPQATRTARRNGIFIYNIYM